jgi:hypothetical protein
MNKKHPHAPINDAWTHNKSVFADQSVWTYKYAVTIVLDSITGGTPSDPKIAKGWLGTRLGGDEVRNQMLNNRLQQTMAERIGADPDATPEQIMDAAIEAAAVNVNGFKRTRDGTLYVEGRTVKAMLKESTSIGLASGTVPARLGLTKKGAPSYVAEHIHVVEDVIELTRDGVLITEPDEIAQSFVHTFRGSGIDYSEVLYGVEASFTVTADADLSDLFPVIFSTAENNGLGARRSQGSGKFVTVKFDAVR